MGRYGRVALALTVAALAGAGAAATAGAQAPPLDPTNVVEDPTGAHEGIGEALPNPYETGEAAVEENDLPDTDHTPQAKETDLWAQRHGARFPEAEVPGDSVTQFSDSLYDVAFINTRNGFAGGAREIDCGGTPTDVPVMYRYGERGGIGLGWELAFVGDCSAPGYIGAIAWIPGRGEAVAVGGTGTYPHREPAYREECQVFEPDPTTGVREPAEPYGVGCDPAGEGRAWHYRDGSWGEITPELPEGARGMSALDFSDNPGRSFGFAGALGQLWRWESGRFDKRWDMHSPCPGALGNPTAVCEFARAERFRFRVREIRFAPRLEPPVAFAVTSGCCAEDRLHNRPSLLAYNERQGPPRWHAATLDPVVSTATDAGTLSANPEGEVDDDAGRLNARQEMPNSFYSLTTGSKAGVLGTRVSAIASPGGPPEYEHPERSSVVTQPYCVGYDGKSSAGFPGTQEQVQTPDQLIEAMRSTLSTVRLVSGDGDTGVSWTIAGGNATEEQYGSPGDVNVGFVTCQNGSAANRDDAVPDWSVGELRSSKAEHGLRAIAFSTVLRPSRNPETLNSNYAPTDPLEGRLPTDAERLEAFLRSQLFALPSYSLNSIDVIDPTGTGWAVGEHGAILELGGTGAGGGSGASASEPDPPPLGARRPGALPSADPYDAQRPNAHDEPGRVATLAEQPPIELSEPDLVPTGSPWPTNSDGPVENVRQVVTSRDGSEAWAIGPFDYDGTRVSAMTTLFHFHDGIWSRCDAEGIEGQVAPDPECAALLPLRRYRQPNGSPAPVRFLAASRVPLEYDADPTNDDEFEVVAIGSKYRERDTDPERFVLVRYRDGSWTVDREMGPLEMPDNIEPSAIAFAAPDDGWALQTTGKGLGLLHFDGERWTDCTPSPGPPPAACGDPEGLLEFGGDAVRGMVSAGPRVYLYGTRRIGGSSFPMIITREAGGRWSADPASGGLDPGGVARRSGGTPPASEQGAVDSLSVAPDPDGGIAGWAVGRFQAPSLTSSVQDTTVTELPSATVLMRFDGVAWTPFPDTGPVRDYLAPRFEPGAELASLVARPVATNDRLQATIPGAGDEERALIAEEGSGRIFSFDSERQRWELLPQPRPRIQAGAGGPVSGEGRLDGPVHALAADGGGGAWIAIGDESTTGLPSQLAHDDFFHYTARPPTPVFSEAPSPLRSEAESFTALAGSADGTVLGATRSSVLYRYDRLLGWDRVSVPGWDPGRVVTRTSEMRAIAVGPSGEGLVVGEGGRIAEVFAGDVRLDRAAGTSCVLSGSDAPPCGTSRTLISVDVAPDGSALAGGERRALLYRPAGGEFRAVTSPDAPPSDSITGISMPEAGAAYLTTDSGQVFRGSGGEAGWSWERENLNARGDILALDRFRGPIPLRAIAVDASGRGLAVGDDGLILRRTPDEDHPWERLETRFLDDLTAVALPEPSGEGALIGGRNGLVLTYADGEVDVARAADRFSPRGGVTGTVVGLAIAPGHGVGEVEAWAATEGFTSRGGYNAGVSQLFHHSSDPSDPLLDGRGTAAPLPDAPPPRPGELSFAALGKTECRRPVDEPCLEMDGSAQDYQVATQRAIEEIAARAREPGGPSFAVFTGDAADMAGTAGTNPTGDAANVETEQLPGGDSSRSRGALPEALKLRRFRELVVDRLAEEGVPAFGAIGAQDLSDVSGCVPTREGNVCAASTRPADTGDNLAWREAFAGQPAPWGTGATPSADGLSFAPVGDGETTLAADGAAVADPDGAGPAAGAAASAGGARTHYAVDVLRAGEPVARLVVLDSSLRSLAASDPAQRPLEAKGQLDFLERMICPAGSETAAGEPCSRSAGQEAIVVSNTPTHTYGPGAITDTAADAAAVEELLLRHRATVLVSGRLGWNALYYTLAPGIHEPGPGGAYPERPPEGGLAGIAGGMLPAVVASSAGGKFGPDGDVEGSAADGFWHGYTIVRVPASGEPREVFVEQRPVFDWIDLGARSHEVGPRQRLPLDGVGREPIGVSSTGEGAGRVPQRTRYDRISSAAITHRYDLLLADPEQPWLPCREGDSGCESLHANISVGASGSEAAGEPGENPCAPYLCLPERIGTVDSTSGEVRAGDGRYPETFAIAMLSVADKSATYPLVFEKSPSFVVRSQLRTPGLPLAARGSAPAPPPPPDPPTPPRVPQIDLPAIPEPPAIPPMEAASPPEPTPPAPPAPPPPSQQPAPLDLSVAPAGLTLSTPAAVIQPPTPPVNPAPPSGARREARQRQAAAQKSGADSAEGAEETREAGGDLASSPNEPGTAMTRHDASYVRRGRERPEPSFTAYRPAADSPIGPGILYASGLTLLAFALAAGWSRGRPTPRRGEPKLPAPAWTEWRR